MNDYLLFLIGVQVVYWACILYVIFITAVIFIFVMLCCENVQLGQ